MKLFCFPFAGGSKYSYTLFQRYASPRLELVPVDLPGRGGRFADALLTDMDAIVDDVFQQIRNGLDKPYAFYGHSMGTVIAYQLLEKLEEQNLRLPEHLFLSGRGGPATEKTDRNWNELPSAAFRQKLMELGGSPKEVLEEESLMSFLEPILRADFKAIEQFTYPSVKPRPIPVSVTIGSDEMTTLADAEAWQEISLQPIELNVLPGGHFFIFEQAEAMMKHIQQVLFHPIKAL